MTSEEVPRQSEMTHDEEALRHRMTVNGVPQMYQSALLDNEYMESLLKQTDKVHKKRQNRIERSANLAKITFWALAFQACIGILLFLWLVVLTPTFCIVGTGFIPNIETALVLQTSEGMQSQWNRQQEAMKEFGRKIHEKVAQRKLQASSELKKELVKKNEDALGWRRHLPGSGAHAAIELQGGFMSVSAGSFSREVEQLTKPIVLCTKDRVDEDTLKDRTVQEEFKEGSKSCYDPSQALMLQDQRVLETTTKDLQINAKGDGVTRMKESVRGNSYPSNTLYVTQQTRVNHETDADTLNIGDVIHGYDNRDELERGDLELKVTRPEKYQGAAQIYSALDYCAKHAEESVVQQCIIVADASGTCRFREWKYMKDYCDKFGGEDLQCKELLKSKMPADIGKDDWKDCTELVSMNKLNVTLMIFADTAKQDKRLMKATGFRGFAESVTRCKFEEVVDPDTQEISYEIPPINEEETNLDCARIILSRDLPQMEAKVEQLAKSINFDKPQITAPPNPEHDPKYTWFLLLMLPLILYMFYIQIANCVIKLQRRARVLAGQKKRRIKIVKTLVVRPPDAARNKSLLAVRSQLGDVELAALATMRTPLMHGNTINLRAKLRGAYVRAPEEGMPIIADGKAVEWGSDWQVERVKGFGAIMQGDECYLKDQEGLYLALAESEDGRQACITVKDKDSAQLLIFGRALTAAEEANEQQDRYPIRVGDTVSIREPSGGLLRAIRAERNIQGGVVGDDEGFMDFKGQENGLDIFFEVDVGGDLLMSDTLLVLQHELTGKNIESRAAQPIHMTDEGSPARFFTIEKHESTGAEEGSSEFLVRGDLVKIRNVHGEYLRVNADDPTKIESAPFPLPAPASSGSSEQPSAGDNTIQHFLFALDKLGVDVDRKDPTIRLDAALALRSAVGDRAYIKVTSEGEISCDGSRLDKNIGFRVSIDNAVSELKARNQEKRKRAKTMKKEKKKTAIPEEEDEQSRETAKVKQREIEKALAALDDQEVMQKELEQKRKEEEQRKKLEQEKEAGKYKWKVTSNTNYIRGGGAVMKVDFGKGPLPPSAQNKIKVDAETGKQVADTSQGASFQVSRADFNPNVKVASVCYIDEESFINKELNDSQFDLDDANEAEALDEVRARAIQEQLPDDSDYMIDYQFESVEVGYDVSNEELAEEDMIQENESAWTPVPRVKKQHFAVAVAIIAASTVLLMIFVGVKISARWTPAVGDRVQDLEVVRRLNAMDRLEPPQGMPNFYIQAPKDKPCDNSTKSEAYHASQKNMVSFDFLGVKPAGFPDVTVHNRSYGKVFRQLTDDQAEMENLGTIRIQVDIMGKMFDVAAYEEHIPHEVPEKFKDQAENVKMWIMAIISEYMLDGSTPIKVDKKLKILPPKVAWPSDETQYFSHVRPFFEHVNEFTFLYHVELPKNVPVKRTTYAGSWVKDKLAHDLCGQCKQDEEFKDAILRAIEESQAMYPHDTAWTAKLNLDVVGLRIEAEDYKTPGENYLCDAMTEAFMYPKKPVGAYEIQRPFEGGKQFFYQVAPGYQLQGLEALYLQPKSPRDQESDKSGQWEHMPVKKYDFCPEIKKTDIFKGIKSGQIGDMRSMLCESGYLPQPLNTDTLEIVDAGEIEDTAEDPAENGGLLTIRSKTGYEFEVALTLTNRLPLLLTIVQYENAKNPPLQLNNGLPAFKQAWVSKVSIADGQQFELKYFWELSSDNGISSFMNDTRTALQENKKVFIELLQKNTFCSVGDVLPDGSATGKWTGSFECTPISCGEPPEEVANAVRVDSQIKAYGEKAAYECNEGYGAKKKNEEVQDTRGFFKECGKQMRFDSDTTCELYPRYCVSESRTLQDMIVLKLDEAKEPKCKSGYTSPVGVKFSVVCQKGEGSGNFHVESTLKLKDGVQWPEQAFENDLQLVPDDENEIPKSAEDTLTFRVAHVKGKSASVYKKGGDIHVMHIEQLDDGKIKASFASKELKCSPIQQFCPEETTDQGTIPAGPKGQVDKEKLKPAPGYQVNLNYQLECKSKIEVASGWEGEWVGERLKVFEKKDDYCRQAEQVEGLVSVPSGKVGQQTGEQEGDAGAVQCAEGWEPSGTSLVCKVQDASGGLWRAEDGPPCKKVECEQWPQLKYATKEQEESAATPQFGDQATYTCDAGWVIANMRTYTITCNKDGKHAEFENTEDKGETFDIKKECTKKDDYCPRVPSFHGIESVAANEIGSSETLLCRMGYKREAEEKVIKCEAGPDSADTGKWSEHPEDLSSYCTLKPDYCPQQSSALSPDDFPETHNVIVEGGKLGETKAPSCQMGYDVSVQGLECKEDTEESGQWDPESQCKRRETYCPALHNCEEKEKCGPAYFGKKVSKEDVPCPPGQEYKGSEAICSTDTEDAGVFRDHEGNVPACTMIEGFCPETEIENGKISASQYQAEAKIICSEGYKIDEISGNCGLEGKFVFPTSPGAAAQQSVENGEAETQSLPGCKRDEEYCKADEGDHRDVFAKFNLPDGHLNAVAEKDKVECDKGHEIKGSLQCTESKKWQLCEDECKDIVCTKVQCKVEEAEGEQRHAKEDELNKRETKIWEYGEERIFECNDGYVFIPDPEKGTEQADFTIKCLETRAFEDHACTQKEDYCPEKPTVECIGVEDENCFTLSDSAGRTFGAVATITCNPGYYVDGDDEQKTLGTSTCKTDTDGDHTTGSWTKVSCRVDTKFCATMGPEDQEELGLSEAIPNGLVNGKHKVTCKNGYSAKIVKLTCKAQADGKGVWVNDNDNTPVVKTELCELTPDYCPARTIDLTPRAKEVKEKVGKVGMPEDKFQTKGLQLGEKIEVIAPNGMKIQNQAGTSVQVECTEGNDNSGELDKTIVFDADFDYCPQVQDIEEKKIKAAPQTHVRGDTISMSCQLGYVEKDSQEGNFEMKCDQEADDSNTGKWTIVGKDTEFTGCVAKESYCLQIDLGFLDDAKKEEAQKQLLAGTIGEKRDWDTNKYCQDGYEGRKITSFTCTAATEEEGQWLPKPECTQRKDFCTWNQEDNLPGVMFLPSSALDDTVAPICHMGYKKQANYKCVKEGEEQGTYKKADENSEDPCGKVREYCQQRAKNSHTPGVPAKALGETATVSCVNWKEPTQQEVTCEADDKNKGKYVPTPACKKKADYCETTVEGATNVGLLGQREETTTAQVLSDMCGAGYEYKHSVICNDDCDDIKKLDERCEEPKEKGKWYNIMKGSELSEVTAIQCTKVKKFCGSYFPNTYKTSMHRAEIDETITLTCKKGYHAEKQADTKVQIEATCKANPDSKKGEFQAEKCVKVEKWCNNIEGLGVPDGKLHDLAKWKCPIGEQPRLPETYNLKCMENRNWKIGNSDVKEPKTVCRTDFAFCSVDEQSFVDGNVKSLKNLKRDKRQIIFKYNEESTWGCHAGYEEVDKDTPFKCIQNGDDNKGKLSKDPLSLCKKVTCTGEINKKGIVLKAGTFPQGGIEFQEKATAVCEPGYKFTGYRKEGFDLKCQADKKLHLVEKHNCHMLHLCECPKPNIKTGTGGLVCAGDFLKLKETGTFICPPGHKSTFSEGEEPEITCEVDENKFPSGTFYSEDQQRGKGVLKTDKEEVTEEFLKKSCGIIPNYCTWKKRDEADKTHPVSVEGFTVNSVLTVTCQTGWLPEAEYTCAANDGERGKIVLSRYPGMSATPTCKESTYWCPKPDIMFGKWRGTEAKYGQTVVVNDCDDGYTFPYKLKCGEDRKYTVEGEPKPDRWMENAGNGKILCIPIEKYCVAEVRIGKDGKIPKDWNDFAEDTKGVKIRDAVTIAECPVGYEKNTLFDDAVCSKQNQVVLTRARGKSRSIHIKAGLEMCKRKEGFCDVHKTVGHGRLVGTNRIYDAWDGVCTQVRGYEAVGTTCCTSNGEHKVVTGMFRSLDQDAYEWCEQNDQKLIKDGLGPESSCRKVQCKITDDEATAGNYDKGVQNEYKETSTMNCKHGYGFTSTDHDDTIYSPKFRCSSKSKFIWDRFGNPFQKSATKGQIPACEKLHKYCSEPLVKCNPITHEGHDCVEKIINEESIQGIGDKTLEIRCYSGYELVKETEGREEKVHTAPKLECLKDTKFKGKWDASYKCKAKTCEIPEGKWDSTKVDRYNLQGQTCDQTMDCVDNVLNHHDYFRLTCQAGYGPEKLNGKAESFGYRESKVFGYCDGETGKIYEIPADVPTSSRDVKQFSDVLLWHQKDVTGCKKLTDYCPANNGVPAGHIGQTQKVLCPEGHVSSDNLEKNSYEIKCKEGSTPVQGKWDPSPASNLCTLKQNFCGPSVEGVILPGGTLGEQIKNIGQEHCTDSTVPAAPGISARCKAIDGEGLWELHPEKYNREEVCVVKECESIRETISNKGLIEAGDHWGIEGKGCDECQTNMEKKDGTTCSCQAKCESGYFSVENSDEVPEKSLKCSKGKFQDIPKCYSTIELEVKNFNGKVVKEAKVTITDNKKENDQGQEFSLGPRQDYFQFNKVCEHCTIKITGEDNHVPMTVEFHREKDCGNRQHRDSNMKLKCVRRTIYLVYKVEGTYDKETCTVQPGPYEIRVGMSWPKNTEQEAKDHDLIIRPVSCDNKAKKQIKEDVDKNREDVWKYRCSHWRGDWCDEDKLGPKEYVAAIYETFQKKVNGLYVPLESWYGDHPMKQAGELKNSFDELSKTCVVEAQSANWREGKESEVHEQELRLVQCLRNSPDEEVKYWKSLNQYDKWVMGTLAARMTKLVDKNGKEAPDSEIVINHDDMTAPGSETITLKNVPVGKYEIMVTNGNPQAKEPQSLTAEAQVNIFLPGDDQTSLAIKCVQKEKCSTKFMWRVAVLEIIEGTSAGTKTLKIHSGPKEWSTDLDENLFGVMDEFDVKSGNEGSWRGQKKLGGFGGLYQEDKDHDVGTPSILTNWKQFGAKETAIQRSCTSSCEIVREDLKSSTQCLVKTD